MGGLSIRISNANTFVCAPAYRIYTRIYRENGLDLMENEKMKLKMIRIFGMFEFDFIWLDQSRFLMRLSSFFIRDSSSGAEADDEDEAAAAAEGDCIEVAATGAVVLFRDNVTTSKFSRKFQTGILCCHQDVTTWPINKKIKPGQ